MAVPDRTRLIGRLFINSDRCLPLPFSQRFSLTKKHTISTFHGASSAPFCFLSYCFFKAFSYSGFSRPFVK
jgi:hypothetical protein